MAEAKATAKKEDEKKTDNRAVAPVPGAAPPFSPGPAQYNINGFIGNNNPIGTNALKLTMSAKLKVPMAPMVPGPGAYAEKEVLGKGVPKFSMRPRYAAPKSEGLVGGAKAGVIAPGPGAYTFHDPGCKKISMLGKTKDSKPPSYPGPQYNMPEYKVPGVKIGKEKRDAVPPGHAKQKRPDPTSYNLPELMGKDSRKINLKGGRDKPQFFLTPGPGAYNYSAPEKKGWSMGARHKQAATTFVSSTNPLVGVRTEVQGPPAPMQAWGSSTQ
jgi:hypothetical protein